MSERIRLVANAGEEIRAYGEGLPAAGTPVQVCPAFPFSDIRGPLLILDLEGRLLCTFLDSATAPEAVRSAANSRPHAVRVQSVRSVEGQGDLICWEVDTQQGCERFQCRDRASSFVNLVDGRWAVVDENGRAYEFDHLAAMDENSRWEAEHYLPSPSSGSSDDAP